MRIPKTFHWIWFGTKPIPDQHQRWIQGWRDLHPGWDYRIWNDSNRPSLVNEAQFIAADNYSLKANIARYEIINRYGGVYLDTDFECLRCIEPLISDVEAFIAAEEPNSVKDLGVGIFGATPGHPWTGELVARLPKAMATGWGNQHQGGPIFARYVTVGRADVTVFPENLFQHLERDPYPETYAVHRAAFSWREAGNAKHSAKIREFLEQDVKPVVRPGARYILVNKGVEFEIGENRRAIPFPERDGTWAGYPPNDAAAITELERQRDAGAQFIVFPAPMFYWLDTYPGLKAYLYTRTRCALANDRAIIFELSDQNAQE